jgi:hypothetical protein
MLTSEMLELMYIRHKYNHIDFVSFRNLDECEACKDYVKIVPCEIE